MKFDMGRAWERAMQMIKGNLSVLAILAGVFFFLPNVLSTIVSAGPTAELEAMMAGGNDADPEALMAALSGFFAEVWWLILLSWVIQAIGIVSILALLTDNSRPTVGDTIKIGVTHMPTYLVASVLTSIFAAFVAMIPVFLGALLGPVVAVLMALVSIALFVYLFTKFLLVPAVIGVERELNPIAALIRSWKITKGNTFLLFVFFFLLIVAAVIVLWVATMVVGVVFALFGPTIQVVGEGIIVGALNAGWLIIFVAALAASHRQVTSEDSAAVSETFD